MKRFIAYLSIFISVILGIVVFAKPTVQGINAGYDYGGAREFVYQIVNPGETIDDFTEIEDPNAIDDIAKEFESRLQNYGVDKYNIIKEGNDKIKVTFSAKDDATYGYISNYLTFDGNLSLVTYDGEVVFNNFIDTESGDRTVMFGEEPAYLTYKNSIYPGIVIPLTNPTEFQEKAVAHAEELNIPNEEEEIEVSQEGNIYLWTRYNRDQDNFTNANENENIKEKLVLSFPYSSIWFEENEEDHSSIVFYFNVDGLDQNSSIEDIDWALVSQVTDRANYYLQLLNASHLEYRVYNLYDTKVDASLENLVNYGLSISPSMSQTLLATTICFAVIILVAGFIFRLNGVTMSITSALGILITLFCYNLLNATFTFATLLGFIIVSLMLYTNSLLYSYKMSLELKKGKNVKKAFQDASRKMNWYSLDISVIGVIFGAIVYILGNTYISGLGIIVFFGSLVNFILQFVVNKTALYFLSTSSINEKFTSLHGNIQIIENKETIDASTEDTEMVDSEENKNKKKEKKIKGPGIFGICLGVLAIVCTLSLSIFSGISTAYNESPTYVVDNYAYVYIKKPNTTYDTPEELETLLNLVRFNDGTNDEYSKIYTGVVSKDYSSFTNPDESNQSTEFNYFIYSIKLNSGISLDSDDFYIVNVTSGEDGEIVTPTEYRSSITECLDEVFSDDIKFTINSATAFGLSSSYDLGPIALSTFISIIAITVYIAIRHKFSAAIIGFSFTTLFALISMGIFSILRTPVYNYISFATLPIVFVTSIIIIVALCKYKEDLTDTKVKNMSADFRRKTALDNKDDNKMYIFFASIISCFVMLCYFGFSVPYTSNTFLLALFSTILVYLAISSIFIPFLVKMIDFTANKHFKISLPKSNKKKLKQEHKNRQKGKEVEEATFIGIND